jgi:hypothetical protein
MEFELPIDFKELLQLFDRHGVKYLLVGGYAVGLHGHVRATNDIDIVVAPDEENAEKVVTALLDFGLADPRLNKQISTTPRSLVVMGVEPFAVDIINYLEGVDFYEAYVRREVRQAEDIQISLISLKDLIANKTAVARDQDKLDVKELIRKNEIR